MYIYWDVASPRKFGYLVFWEHELENHGKHRTRLSQHFCEPRYSFFLKSPLGLLDTVFRLRTSSSSTHVRKLCLIPWNMRRALCRLCLNYVMLKLISRCMLKIIGLAVGAWIWLWGKPLLLYMLTAKQVLWICLQFLSCCMFVAKSYVQLFTKNARTLAHVLGNYVFGNTIGKHSHRNSHLANSVGKVTTPGGRFPPTVLTGGRFPPTVLTETVLSNKCKSVLGYGRRICMYKLVFF